MQSRALTWTAVAAAALLLAACERPGGSGSDTRVLGGFGSGPRTGAAAPAPAASVPAPPVPRTSRATTAQVATNVAVAVWQDDGRVMSSRYTREAGWSAPQALEAIGGAASNPRVATNGRGVAMAVWQHSVGRIDSLRFSRYEEGRGWSPPDVMPGALPRPRQPGKTAGGVVEEAAPRIEVDEHGNARAEWLSGFDAGQLQASTYVPGEGWARPVDLPLQAGALAGR